MSDVLEELQVKLAFLEDALSKLGDEFYLQQRELRTLKSQYAGIMDKMSNQDNDSSANEILDEAPPHY